MSNYKLVPVEPTDEMVVRGAEDIRDTLRMFDIEILDDLHNATEIEQHVAESCFNAMVADAPEVEQEPAGVIREDEQAGVAPYADIWPRLEPGTKLYAAPAPQPDVTQLVEVLEGIYQYGADTLSGRMGMPPDSEWYREGIRTMVLRAKSALATHRKGVLDNE